MSFPTYTPTPTEPGDLVEADGSEPLQAATTNVSLEQLADWIAWLTRETRPWAKITTNGLGGVTVDDHEGIDTGAVTVTSTYVQVTFLTAFANTNYSPVVSSLDGTPLVYSVNASTMTTTTIRVHIVDAINDATVDPSGFPCKFALHVKGHY